MKSKGYNKGLFFARKKTHLIIASKHTISDVSRIIRKKEYFILQ